MLSQVSFTVDRAMKQRVLEKAKNDGVTLKAILTYAMKGFADGNISLGFKTAEAEKDVEEIHFDNKAINEYALKIAKLLD